MDTSVLETKIRNLTLIVITGFIITFLLLIGLYFNTPATTSSTTKTSTSSTGSSTSSYDTSRLTLLDKETSEELKDSKGVKFIYVGRSGCSVCQSLLPNLNQVIDDLKLEMNYLSIDVKDWRTEYASVFDLLSIETTITSSKGTYTGTYGELLNEHGFTPMLIVLKDGKMVDGLVGSRDVSTLKTFYEKYI